MSRFSAAAAAVFTLPALVPAGVWEYGVSAGECRSPRCGGAANLDLRHGVSRRWTVRAGLDQLWGGPRGALSHPYAAVVGTPTNALGIEAEAVANLLYRAGLRLEPSDRLRVTGDYVSYADSSSESPFLPPGTLGQWSLYGRLMPSRRAGAVVLEAQGTRTLTTSGARAQLRTSAAFQLESMVLRPYVRSERMPAAAGVVQRNYLGLDATVLPQRALGPVLGGVWFQGHAERRMGPDSRARRSSPPVTWGAGFESRPEPGGSPPCAVRSSPSRWFRSWMWCDRPRW
ncbi:MAG: hypothetical protein H0T68_06395 [Gemmatimonadales bacterium]|nr:hypothetical protein [Gemmatimonadales bacterium]